MNKKTGLDDYLLKHDAEDFRGLAAKEVTVGTDVTQNRVLINNDLDIIRPISFPFEVFPEPVQKLIQVYNSALQIEPELVALMMMGVLSGAIGNTIRVSVKEGWNVPPFLWVAYIAESGYGKSPAQSAILHPVKFLQAKDTDQYQTEFKSYEEILRKCRRDETISIPDKPRATQKLVSDITTEALADVFENDGRGVISDKDELSGLVLSFDQYRTRGGDDRQKWLSLFNCEPMKIDRKAGTRFIKNTGIAIIGGIQAKVLPEVFSGRAFDDGLLPRFLLYNAKNKIPQFNRQGIDEDAREGWHALVSGCYQIPCVYGDHGFIKPSICILQNQALDVWEAFYNECGKVAPFLSERARVFIPKLTSYYSLKFTGILHVLKGIAYRKEISPVIHKETAEGAIALTRFFMRQIVNVLKLYDRMETHLDEYQERLVRALLRLKDEVKNGKLPLSRIVEELNEGLPANVQLEPGKVARMLHQLGLRTDKSTGNLSYLIWEEKKIEQLFSVVNVTNVTIVPTVNQRPGTESMVVTVLGANRNTFTVCSDQEGWEHGD